MLKKLFFGRKKLVEASGLGVFEARVKGGNANGVVWTAVVDSDIQMNPMVVLLEGDSNGPFPSQISDATAIVKNLVRLKNELLNLISQNVELKLKYSGFDLSKLELAAIYPQDIEKGDFELLYSMELKEKIEFSASYIENEIREVC